MRRYLVARTPAIAFTSTRKVTPGRLWGSGG
jgi:hypothetical protein